MKMILKKFRGSLPVALRIHYLKAVKKKHYLYVFNYNKDKYKKTKTLTFDDMYGVRKAIISLKDFGPVLPENAYKEDSDAFFDPALEEGGLRFNKTLIRLIEENPEDCGNLSIVEIPDGERFIILERETGQWQKRVYEEIVFEKEFLL